MTELYTKLPGEKPSQASPQTTAAPEFQASSQPPSGPAQPITALKVPGYGSPARATGLKAYPV